MDVLANQERRFASYLTLVSELAPVLAFNTTRSNFRQPWHAPALSVDSRPMSRHVYRTPSEHNLRAQHRAFFTVLVRLRSCDHVASRGLVFFQACSLSVWLLVECAHAVCIQGSRAKRQVARQGQTRLSIATPRGRFMAINVH